MIYLLIAVAGLVVGFLVLWFRPAFFASIVFINQWPTEVETVEAHGFRERLRTGALAEGEHSIDVKFLLGTEFDFDLQLELKKEEVPPTILTTRAIRKPMLGWTSYAKTQQFEKDDPQLVLQFAA